jgi:cyclase
MRRFSWFLLAACAYAQEIEIVPLRGNIYVITGAGANITASVGPDGIFLVDSGSAAQTDKVLAALKELGVDTSAGTRSRAAIKPPKPVRYIANTNWQADYTGGNAKIAAAGKTFTGGNVAGDLGDVGEGAAILSHEDTLQRLSDVKVPTRALPTETYFGKSMKLSHFFNGEGVVLYQAPAANSNGVSFVHFRGSDVISAGPLFDFTSYPLIDLQKGGTIQGVLDGLNHMLDLVVPEFRSEGGTLIVPGKGRAGDMADLAYYRDMVTIIKDRVEHMVKKDMTLAQIQAAKPTEDWDGRFGKNPAWTPAQFVEAIYRTLPAAAKAKVGK